MHANAATTRKLVAAGIDPSAQRKATKAARIDAAANSFEVVAREWMAKQTFVPSYAVKVSAWFERNVFPWLGARPVSELTARDFLGVLQRVEARGAHESAHRIKQNCGQVMRYAVATGRADRDPTGDLKGALTRPTEKHHAALTDPKEVGGLLRAIDGFTGTAVVRAALTLAPVRALGKGSSSALPARRVRSVLPCSRRIASWTCGRVNRRADCCRALCGVYPAVMAACVPLPPLAT